MAPSMKSFNQRIINNTSGNVTRAPRRANRAPKRRRAMMDSENADQEFVIIGPNGTLVPKAVFCSIDFKSYISATRTLLMALFTREILSSHSLTGKISNAFRDRIKTPRPQLDVMKIQDLVQIVMKICEISESDVRRAITKKCCDEHKMMKRKLMKVENQL